MSAPLPKVLTFFSLVMITVTSIDSIRNLPATALFGSSLIFFFIAAAIIFLIPTALVSAELSVAIPQQGGVYIWVRDAFGPRWGFLAIWFQWIENIAWYPTFLSFIAGTFAYLIDPTLSANRYYILAAVLIVFWSMTILNLFGMKLSARFSIVCGLAGVILPMAFIILLGFIWIKAGYPLQISFTGKDILPNIFQPGNLVAFTGVILSYCGMEITTVYAQEVKNPQSDYPRALFLATLILIATLMFGSLAIAIVIPHDQINLVSGIMAAFTNFFQAYHLTHLIPMVAIMILVGSLGGLSNWIIAPCKGLLIAIEDQHLAPTLIKTNRHGAPARILIAQGLLTSLISSVFIFMPAVNSSYWLLTALTSQLYMFMYILMFAAGIYLRFKQPHLPRPYRIPGGNFGMIIIASLGIASSIMTLIVGFFPPDGIDMGGTLRYVTILVIGLVLLSFPPFLLKYRGQ